ncbi:hypothetical protein G3T14_14060 [Methylobacterium sp. BTF04]|uniref:hypothetical protein n=1 Tax=Methylobacterium sp. BTF04 TaxID=2708300 RepID=UPI0013D7DAA4|nr:hypothetical protein [Methylobacterium sp. BTF04]NEU13249.1 hypothetical protein [Methylobacterium sp. BTF04]
MAGPAMRRQGLSLFGLCAILGIGVVPAEARPVWSSGTYVYADLCTVAENGTRAGQRITLRRSPRGDGLVYEAASLSGPVQADTIALDDATKAIDFVAATESGPVHFHGTMAVDSLTGVVEDESGPHPVHLPRVLRPHAHEVCQPDATGSLGAGR